MTLEELQAMLGLIDNERNKALQKIGNLDSVIKELNKDMVETMVESKIRTLRAAIRIKWADREYHEGLVAGLVTAKQIIRKFYLEEDKNV